MQKDSVRLQKLSDLIQQALATFIHKEVRDPRLKTVSLTAVRLSPDVKHARVFFTTLEPNDRVAAEKALTKASGFLRRLLAAELALRYTPALLFRYDESIERGAKLSALINDAIESDKKLRD